MTDKAVVKSPTMQISTFLRLSVWGKNSDEREGKGGGGGGVWESL